jgi:hypothetical protein
VYESNQYSWDVVAEKYGQQIDGAWKIPNITHLFNMIGEEKKARNATDEAAARAFAPGDEFEKHFYNDRGRGKLVPMVKTGQIAYAWRKHSYTEAWWDNLDEYEFKQCVDYEPMAVHYD